MAVAASRVKGLTAVPQVLAIMNDKLDWTQQLGEAFLAQRDQQQRCRQLAIQSGAPRTVGFQTATLRQQFGGQTTLQGAQNTLRSSLGTQTFGRSVPK